jgi:hypothetical protein
MTSLILDVSMWVSGQVQSPVTLFPGEEPLVPINQTLSGSKNKTVGKIVLYSYSLYISVFQFFKNMALG